MRYYIIKYFALSHACRVFGKTITFVRAANIIFPIFLLNGLYAILTDSYAFDSFFGILFFIILLIALFFGFVYFRIYPVSYEELEDYQQKWFYGIHCVKSNIHMNILDTRDWNRINVNMKNILRLHDFYNWKNLIINPIAVLLTIILLLIFK